MCALDLIFEVLASEQWAEMLRAPLDHAAATGNSGLALRIVEAGAEIGDAARDFLQAITQVDAVATQSGGRGGLRRAEVHMFDALFEVLTPEQLARSLKATLESAAANGERYLARRLIGGRSRDRGGSS